MKLLKVLLKVLVVLAIILALAGVALFRWLQEPPKVISQEEIERAQGVAVEVESPTRRDFAEYVFCDGIVEGRARSVLRAQIAETIQAVHVDVGDKVELGQVLVEFRKSDLEAQVRARRAAYEEAKNNYDRYQTLLEDKVVSRDAVEARRTALETAAALLQNAESEMAYTEVRAPIGDPVGSHEGRVHVQARYADPGERKGLGDSLLMLVDLSQMEVRALVPETGVSLCGPGTIAEFRLEGEQSWRSGSVLRVSPSTENPNRFYDVFIQAQNERTGGQWLMRVGMYAEVRFVRASAQGALAVRAASVRREGEKRYVFLLRREPWQGDGNPGASTEESKEPGAGPEPDSGGSAKRLQDRLSLVRTRLRERLGMASRGQADAAGPEASNASSEGEGGVPNELWQAHRVEVETGLHSRGYVQLLGEAVSADSVVVANPGGHLRDGVKVRIVTSPQ